MILMQYRMIRSRRKSSVTNYKRRIAALKSGLPRIVVRKSNRGILMQIAEYQLVGDKVLISASSNELKGMGWEPRSNMPTAYLTGLLLAKKAKGLNAKSLILDIGLYRPVKGSVIFAAAKGAKDGGLNAAGEFEVDEKRLSGAHIANLANVAKGDGRMKNQFSEYQKSNFDPAKITEKFEAIKKQLLNK